MKPPANPRPLPAGVLWHAEGAGAATATGEAHGCWAQWDGHARCRPGVAFTYRGVVATVVAVDVADGVPTTFHASAPAATAHAERVDMSSTWELPAAFARGLASAWLGIADEAAMPRPVVPAEMACGVWWLAALGDAMQWGASVAPAVAIDGQVAHASVAITWSVALPAALTPLVCVTRVGFTRPVAPRPMPRPQTSAPLWHTAAAPYPIAVASGTLAAVDARRRLARGAYVVGLTPHPPRLIVGDAGFTLATSAPTSGTYRIISEITSMTDTDATATTLLAHGKTPLSVVIGHASLSFASLAALVPGSLISLGRPPSPQATLYLGGTAVADVELVEADGQLAARVIAVRNQPDAAASAP